MDDPFSPKRYEELEKIRNMPNELVRAEYELCIPPELHLPPSFWQKYNAEQAIIGLRACLLLWCATSRRMIPREFQLQATIALISGQDCLVDVGTGYGKTLCMIIPCLLLPKSISMIVSPLKRLQAVQVVEFESYGIKTVAINASQISRDFIPEAPRSISSTIESSSIFVSGRYRLGTVTKTVRRL